MYQDPDFAGDRAAAITWARALLALKPPAFVLFDCQTTGLTRFAEIVQVAVLASDGTPLLDTLVRPVGPIPEAATAQHHLTEDAVAGAPGWTEIYPPLAALLHHRPVVSYNAPRDQAFITQSHRALGGYAPPVPGTWYCAETYYAAFLSDWDAHHGHYRVPDLPGATHNALADCRATLALLAAMAATPLLASDPRPATEEAR